MSRSYLRNRCARLVPERLEQRVLLTIDAAVLEADTFPTASFGQGVAAGDIDGFSDLNAIGVNQGDQQAASQNDILTIQGTNGDDVVEVMFGPQVTVIVNGNQTVHDVNDVPLLAVNGLNGYDRITVVGSSLDEAASADGDTGEFSFSSDIYQLTGTGIEDVTFNGDTGADQIDLYGSSDVAKKDKLRGLVRDTTMHAGYIGTDPNTSDYVFNALNFDRVNSFGRGGTDYGQVYGTDGDDHFYRFADYEVMVAGDSTQKTKGFSRIDAFGRHGTDVAHFDDTSGDDQFYTFPEFVVMVLGNEQDRVMAKGFLDVSAVSSQGGNDTANLRDKGNLDRLFASEDFALLLRTVEEQRESVLGFANVVGTTVSGVTFALPEDLEQPIPSPVDEPLFAQDSQSFTATNSQGVVAGDLDGDGDLDAFISSHTANSVLLNDGNGNFTEQPATPTGNITYSTEAALGDLDGDGDLDVWVTGEVGSVLINDGAGNLTNGQIMDYVGGGLIHVVLGDLDNDGDLDAATAMYSSAILWENLGDGTFAQGSGFSGTGSCRGIDVGDLDGNGDLDVFLACESNHVVGLADGTGAYNTTVLPFGAKNVALGDLDGDGDLDAYDANLNGHNRVWTNDGSGTFTQSFQPHLEGFANFGSWEVDLGDIDGDGHLDAVDPFAWRNDGSGTFSQLGDTVFDFNRGITLGDWDSDGDLDVIAVDAVSGPAVFENQLMTIPATSGDDVIEIEVLTGHIEVHINGELIEFPINPYLAVDGMGGNDQLIVRGSSSYHEHASANADTGSFALLSELYQLVGSGFEEITFDGSIARVELYGSSDPAKKDKLRGAVGETTLHAGYIGTDPNTADYIFRALNINHVSSYGRGGAGDYAQLFGSDYDDHFYRFADHEVLVAVDSTQTTQGFARVDAFGRHGTDVAYFEDTSGDDQFFTFPEFVVMLLGNDQDRVMAKGFLDVTAVSKVGGADTIQLRNAQTVDTLFASQNVALLLRQAQRESVLGFANVNATALSGETPLNLILDDANVSLTGTWVDDRN